MSLADRSVRETDRSVGSGVVSQAVGGSRYARAMRKFLFNTQLIGAVVGGWSVLQTTRNGPRDWRLPLLWAGWGITVAVAVGTVIMDARQREIEDARFDLEWGDED